MAITLVDIYLWAIIFVSKILTHILWATNNQSIEIGIVVQIFEPSDSVMDDIWSSSKNITDDDTCLRSVFDKILIWNEILVTTIFVDNIHFTF